MSHSHLDTIAAKATPPGRGGVGIIRISGAEAPVVADAILGYLPAPRSAEYCQFKNRAGDVIDTGIALYFRAPHSFTGEDVLELQGHGGPVVLDMLLQQITHIPDVRVAKPGEFTERAFINDKLDLTQAEAIADLINANSQQAAKSALMSLQGEFSDKINHLVERVTQLRMYVEAAIDFPEEEINFLADEKIHQDLADIAAIIHTTLQAAVQGSILRDGMKVVIAGRPNAGKSSLLNSLAGSDVAIVTDIEGTTRDVLREHIHLDGMPLHIIDTAGLRHSPDEIEKIGMDKARAEINTADLILHIQDSTTTPCDHDLLSDMLPQQQLPDLPKIVIIRNKADISQETIGLDHSQTRAKYPILTLSVKNNQGMTALKDYLKQQMGYQTTCDDQFTARQRHVDALRQAQQHLHSGREQLQHNMAGELLAEELRLTQQVLGEITGQFSSDDLLGRIFSSFCIGK